MKKKKKYHCQSGKVSNWGFRSFWYPLNKIYEIVEREDRSYHIIFSQFPNEFRISHISVQGIHGHYVNRPEIGLLNL